MALMLDKSLAEEQTYFDAAWDQREEARQSAKQSGHAGGRYAQIALNNQNRGYLAQLAPADVAVAHGSFTLEDGQTHYVGRDTIWDADREVLVVNWRSDIGELYERANVHDPHGVEHKRTFTTDRNVIQRFEDVVFGDLLKRVAELSDLELSGVDDALLEDLDTSRTGAMRDIVRTIQAAQSHLIRHDARALLVIQGGPGTGKSAVALHRASWLLFNEQGLTPDRVLVVGPNDTFTSYIKNVLPGLGDNNVQHLSLRRLGPQTSTRREEPTETARLKGEHRMVGLMRRALQARIRFAGTDSHLVIGTGPRAVSLDREAVERQLETQRDSPSYNAGRLGMRAWLTRRVDEVDARTRGGVPVDASAIDVALDRVWPPLTAQQFIRDLLGSRNRLQEAGGDDFTAGDVGRLYRKAASRAAAETWSDSDVALLDEADYLINGSPETFLHILVDEAQDLSPMQLRSVARRSANGAMTIVGDIAQSTGPWARDAWNDVVAGLETPNVPVVEEQLSYGYRVPAEIYDVAARLLPLIAPGLEPLTVVRAAPEPPKFIPDDGDLQTIEEAVSAIVEHARRGRFVGVVVPPAYKQALADELRVQDINFSDADRGPLGGSVNLVSAAEAKGLEFDAVVVVEPAEIAALERGMRLLYIALTRATKYLTVVHSKAFEPLGLEGTAPPVPITDLKLDPPAPAAPSESVPLVHLGGGTSLSPAMMAAAKHVADQIQSDVAPAKFEAFVAEVARQLGFDGPAAD